jgi:hypothetical protein
MPAKNKIVSQIVEDLVSFGMDTEYVTRFGLKWGFKLISSEDYLTILQKSSGESYKEDMTRMYKMQIEILRKSLISIDGKNVSESDKEKLFTRVNPTVVNALYRDFETIRQKKDEELEALDKKNEPKVEVKIEENVTKNASIDA